MILGWLSVWSLNSHDWGAQWLAKSKGICTHSSNMKVFWLALSCTQLLPYMKYFLLWVSAISMFLYTVHIISKKHCLCMILKILLSTGSISPHAWLTLIFYTFPTRISITQSEKSIPTILILLLLDLLILVWGSLIFLDSIQTRSSSSEKMEFAVTNFFIKMTILDLNQKFDFPNLCPFWLWLIIIF